MGLGFYVSRLWERKAIEWSLSTDEANYALHHDVPAIFDANLGCDGWINTSDVVPCVFGPMTAPKTAVLFGDSVAAQWFSALAQIYSKDGWQIAVIMKSGCPMVDEPIYYERIRDEYTICESWRNDTIEYLAVLKPALILISGSARYDFTQAEWSAGSRRILEPLSEAASEVLVIRSTPSLPFDASVCLMRKMWQPKFIAQLSECAASSDIQRDNDVWASLHKAAEGLPTLKMLDLNHIACPDGKCVAHNGEINVFMDDTHMTDTYVKSIVGKVNEAILSLEQAGKRYH